MTGEIARMVVETFQKPTVVKSLQTVELSGPAKWKF